MASESTPWKSGTWYNEDFSTQLTIIDGEKMEMINVISLDYPDAKTMMTGVWTHGDFGPANPKIVEKTGIQNYNIEMDSFFGKMHGVLNERGTEIHMIGMSKEPEIAKWLSPEEIGKSKF